MSATTEVQSGLEGVLAFATEIAEPDREGGALRYRGVDIEELVGGSRSSRSGACWSTAGCCPGCPRRSRTRSRPLRRSARRRAVGARDARPAMGVRAADRHLRRGGPGQSRAGVGHGALVRGAVGPRDRQAAGLPARGRQGHLDPRTVPDPLARGGQPGPRQGDRRLLDLGRRARDERLDVHRAGDRLDRCRRRCRALGGRRRALGAASRRRSVTGADDARRGRPDGRRRALRQGVARPGGPADGLRPPGLSRRRPTCAGAPPYGKGDRRAAGRGRRGAREGGAGRARGAQARPRAGDQRRVLVGCRARLTPRFRPSCSRRCSRARERRAGRLTSWSRSARAG